MSKINQRDKQQLFDTFSIFWDLNELNMENFYQLLKKKSFKKGELIINEGQIETNINFLTKGAVHMYTYVDGIQHTISIAQRVFNSYSSYYLECPSDEIHEALTDVELLYMEKAEVEKYLKDSHAFCYIYAKLSEYILLIREHRAKLLLHKSAMERYTLFVETHDNFINLQNGIHQKIIANYLGLSPETYCRVKSQYLKNR